MPVKSGLRSYGGLLYSLDIWLYCPGQRSHPVLVLRPGQTHSGGCRGICEGYCWEDLLPFRWSQDVWDVQCSRHYHEGGVRCPREKTVLEVKRHVWGCRANRLPFRYCLPEGADVEFGERNDERETTTTTIGRSCTNPAWDKKHPRIANVMSRNISMTSLTVWWLLPRKIWPAYCLISGWSQWRFLWFTKESVSKSLKWI